MKKLLIPAFILVMGAGGAFGTQLAKKFAPEDGHRIGSINEDPCVDVSQKCSTSGGTACTWSMDGVTPLYQIDGTFCGEELFRP